ncbi:MAG: galactokinase [Planctomycetota bacterium]
MPSPVLDTRGQMLRRVAEANLGVCLIASVRAPGRVNLIGEHIDYCNLAVLPMAIQRDVRIDFTPREDARVRLANTNPAHPPFEFFAAEEIEPAPQGDWSNYPRAAVQRLVARLGPLRGFDGVVDGSVPEAAGLSSSSALLVASALAILAANEKRLPRLELAELCAEAERYVGTNSGGMDQAISLMAEAGHALRVEFAPLRVEAIPVPPSWRFVIADSLVVAEKSGSLRESYNARRAASEAALLALARQRGSVGQRGNYRELLAQFSVNELLAMASKSMPYELLRRFRHIVSESARVDQACTALRAADAASFGAAMDASQQSLEEDCQVSHPELERLVQLARKHGALGARLTGAGLGGCIVALVLESKAEALLEALAEEFFAERLPARELRHHLLLARPSAGAAW